MIVAILASAILFLNSCHESYITYDDAEYIMFSDTVGVYPVQKDVEFFEVPVVSTVVCDYDRTIGVEVVDEGSTAIERQHYTLKSNTVVIPSGENTGYVYIKGIYDNIDPDSLLSLNLRLVMPEDLVMDMYGDQTKVQMQKICQFDINDFTGWCVTTSTFLYSFDPQKEYQKLVYTEIDPTVENGIICRDWLYKGYDIKLRLDNSDILMPLVHIDGDQVLSDEGSVFGTMHGDDKILINESKMVPSLFYPCGKYLFVWFTAKVENIGEPVGVVGQFYNVMEWVSDEEADRLRREGF